MKEEVKEKLDKHFLYQLFQSETFLSIIIEMGEGAAQHNISLKDVGEIEWDVPKDIDEQKRISKLLTDLDEEIEKLQVELQKYEWLKQLLSY